MKKILPLLFLLISSCNHAFATQITFPTIWGVNDTVTNVKLNNDNNAVSSVVNGNIDNTNTAPGYALYKTVAALPSPGNQGSVDFLTSNNTLNLDTGSAWITTITPNGALATGNIPYYNAGWQQLSPGAQYLTLVSNGVSSLPSYQTLSLHAGGTGQDLSANDQGDVYYDNGSNAFTRLTPGSNGQFLETQGASANPKWATVPVDTNTSNVLFENSAVVDDKADITAAASLNASTVTFHYLGENLTNGSTSGTIWRTKFKKISTVSTTTIYCQTWLQSGSGTPTVNVNIGGATGSGSGVLNAITPQWINFNIDVSGLTNGTVYDVTFTLTEAGNTQFLYLGNLIAFGS